MSLVIIGILFSISTKFDQSNNQSSLFGTWYLKSEKKKELLFVKTPLKGRFRNGKIYRVELIIEEDQLIYKSILFNEKDAPISIKTLFYEWCLDEDRKILKSKVKEQFGLNILKISQLNSTQLKIIDTQINKCR